MSTSAPSPKNIRELQIAQQGFERYIAGQLELLKWAVGLLYPMIVAIVGGGFAMYFAIGKVQTDVATVARDLAAIDKRIERIEKALDGETGVLGSMRSIAQGVARLEAPNIVAIPLSSQQQNLIREVLNVRGRDPSAQPRFVVGATLPSQLIQGPLPDLIVKAIPQLAKARYGFDPNTGAAVIVDAQDRILAVIAPV